LHLKYTRQHSYIRGGGTMSTKTKLAITGGIIVGVLLIVLATLGVQSLLQNKSAPQPVVEAATTTPVVEAQPATPPMAQVISVKPHVITETITVNKCHQVPTTVYTQQEISTNNTHPVGGTLMGGALGGLAGSAVHGSARTAAILAGAGLGAYAGHEMQSQRSASQYRMIPKTVYSSKCGKQTVTKKIDAGYEVTYWYNGTEGTIIMPVTPASNTIPLPTALDQGEQLSATNTNMPAITSSKK
jgi:uncharacterized protein YcfJ